MSLPVFMTGRRQLCPSLAAKDCRACVCWVHVTNSRLPVRAAGKTGELNMKNLFLGIALAGICTGCAPGSLNRFANGIAAIHGDPAAISNLSASQCQQQGFIPGTAPFASCLQSTSQTYMNQYNQQQARQNQIMQQNQRLQTNCQVRGNFINCN